MKQTNDYSQQLTEPDPDVELQALLHKGAAALDAKTREFIEEVLRYVPEERTTRYEIEVSHEGVVCGNEG